MATPSPRIFTYDEVFPESCHQYEVYAKSLKPLLPDFLRGINVSLFCCTSIS